MWPEGALPGHMDRSSYVAERSESPIEHRLATALLESHKFVVMPDDKVTDELDRYHVGFVMQFPVGRYRLDIALFFRTLQGDLRKVAVECDGLRFHIGLKAEARDQERDRYLAGEGFEVWRYPGWLLHHGAECAADEIQKAVEEIISGRAPVRVFARDRAGDAPTVAEYEAAYWAFDATGLWPQRLGPNPIERGWKSHDDFTDWVETITKTED